MPKPLHLPKNNLTFHHFVFQSSLIHAYRSAVRSTRPLPDPQTRRETLDFLRSDLERLRYVTDLDVLNSHLSAFQRSFKTLVPAFGLGGLTAETGAKLIGRRGGKR